MKFKFFAVIILSIWCFTVNFVFNGNCHTCKETIQLHTQGILDEIAQ